MLPAIVLQPLADYTALDTTCMIRKSAARSDLAADPGFLEVVGLPSSVHAPASVIVRAPQTLLDTVLWPEFQEINAVHNEYLAQVTDRVIREGVYKETGDAEQVPEPEWAGSRRMRFRYSAF